MIGSIFSSHFPYTKLSRAESECESEKSPATGDSSTGYEPGIAHRSASLVLLEKAEDMWVVGGLPGLHPVINAEEWSQPGLGSEKH